MQRATRTSTREMTWADADSKAFYAMPDDAMHPRPETMRTIALNTSGLGKRQAPENAAANVISRLTGATASAKRQNLGQMHFSTNDLNQQDVDRLPAQWAQLRAANNQIFWLKPPTDYRPNVPIRVIVPDPIASMREFMALSDCDKQKIFSQSSTEAAATTLKLSVRTARDVARAAGRSLIRPRFSLFNMTAAAKDDSSSDEDDAA